MRTFAERSSLHKFMDLVVGTMRVLIFINSLSIQVSA